MNITVLPNLAATTVLMLTLFYAWRLLRERYLLIWALASGIWMARYVAIAFDPSLAAPDSLISIIHTPIRVALFMVGAAELTGRWPRRVWWAALVTAAVWGVAARPYASVEFASMPTWLAAGAGTLWVAHVLLGCDRFGRVERAIAAWPIAVYGVQIAIFSWNQSALAWYAPYSYFVTSLCQLLAAMGFLMLCFDGAERESVAAHERLTAALGRVLSGHLVICERCQSIRTDTGTWERIEIHVGNRSGTRFSHGICESCLRQHYGDWG